MLLAVIVVATAATAAAAVAAAAVAAYHDTCDRPDHIMQVSYDVDDNIDDNTDKTSAGGGGGGGVVVVVSIKKPKRTLISHRKLASLTDKPICIPQVIKIETE